ncbi:hypothetical protein [Halorussus marinus]|uniref:hypothetical protein n=1 Tax=Halorussus marinus TaxID=2505976 RepID=UPI00106E47B1|nr:hypothetical protein [Halorussus marinus]
MSRRPQLSRQVPATAVTDFDDWCEREGHVNGGDKGRNAEQAILEYLPPRYRPERFRDDLDELEADLRADLDEVGLLTDGSSLNGNHTSTSSETVKLTYRVAEDVQDALEQYVYDQEGKVRGVIGEYVAVALDEYRDGGQAARVRRYYEQLQDGVDMVSEDRVGAVVEQLKKTDDRDYYNIKTIREVVDRVLDVHSEDVRNDFADRVIERLGFVSVETSDGVYATPERAEELVQNQEIDSSLDWYLMDKEDRVEYLRDAVRARSKVSAAGVDYNQVRDNVFEEKPSNDYCYELMELAGEAPNFKYGAHNGRLMLRYTGTNGALEARPDEEWIDEAVKHVHEFCSDANISPNQIDQPLLDNRIVRSKFPNQYDDVTGPSRQAMNAVTDDDRQRVLEKFSNGDFDGQPEENAIKTETDQITRPIETITDGGEELNSE